MLILRLRSAVFYCVALLLQLSSVCCQFNELCVAPLNDTDYGQQPCISNYDQCKNLVTLSTSMYSYDGDTQSVNISLNTTSKEPHFYYKLCSRIANTEDIRLVQCVKGNKTVHTNVYWNVTGLNDLAVEVYTDSNYTNFVDCTVTRVLVANNGGLRLNVTVSQTPQDIVPVHLYSPTVAPINPALPVTPTCSIVPHTSVYVVGNVTFTASINLTNYMLAHFKYDFGDGHRMEIDNVSTVANYYSQAGHYRYRVDAIVELEDDEVAVHKKRENTTKVYERVINPSITVGGDNSVQLGVTDVHVTVNGSFPIRMCWCVVMPNNTACVTVPVVDQIVKSNITCQTLNNTQVAPKSFAMKTNFTQSGEHKIWANFSNIVDCHNKSFSFYVYIPNPDVIIFSTTTIGVLAALLVVTIIVIFIIVTVVIPYRRYKTRMTETANFKFIELSESTATIKGKMQRSVSNFKNYFRSNSEGRIGLVNTDRTDLGERERLINRDRVAQFAPYESL